MSARGSRLRTGGLLSLVLIAGAGFALTRPPRRAADAGLDVIRLPNTIADGAHLADEKGFFAANRIRIEWTGKQAHGPAGIVSLVAGQNDAAGSISTAMIIARGNGSKLKMIASSSTSSERAPLFRYLVKDGSPITGKPEDFIGKTVVAHPTTITWYPLVVLLTRAGLDYHKVKFVSLPSPLATEQALRQGEVDVVAGSENNPPGSKLLAEGGVHALPGVSDFEVLGIQQIGGWVMRDDYIEAHPDVVRRFIVSLTDAYQWGNQHPAEAREIISRRNGVPEAFRKYQGVWRGAPPTALVDGESIRKWIAILEEFEQIKRGSIKPEDVFTNAYNPHAAQARATP
ncbi:MAG TPA: ABC transporter substrate-binding protein [Polyangiaceae bacterium]|nr:ABC transporter substrate-binding protein [Polyangiaceae bacterium]